MAEALETREDIAVYDEDSIIDTRQGTSSPGIPSLPFAASEANESYFQLVWRRFRRSKVSIIGAGMVITLVLLAVFAEFFSPTSLSQLDLKASSIPPQQVHFFDDKGNFHLIPFVYNYTYELNPKTFQVAWAEDTSKPYEIQFF